MAKGEGQITKQSWGRGAIMGSPKSSEAVQEQTPQITNGVVSLDSERGANLTVFSSCSCCLSSCAVACPASASESMQFILLPCKIEILDSGTPILMLICVRIMFCLGLRKALWLEHFDCGHVLDSAPIFHSLTAIRISVCNLLFLLQSEFLLLSFLLFWICNPSGHPMKHKSNSSAGELSLDFTIYTGQLHFWSWVKIHMPHCLLLILVFEIHLAWSRVSFRRKKTHVINV